MKKTKIITTAVALLIAATMFAGCSREPLETAVATRIEGGQTQISVEISQDDSAFEGEYYFSKNGYKIMPGMSSAEAVAICGDEYDQRQDASCAGQGVDVAYMYNGFTLGAYKVENVELIQVIDVTDGLIDCGGVHVGDSVKATKELLGTPDDSDDYGFIYKGKTTQLQIITDGVDKILEIVYRVEG